MHEKLEEADRIVNATDPDLEAFRDHGGKIIIYRGFADLAIPPSRGSATTGPSRVRWAATRLFNPSAVST
jgi:hypothetical protein